MMDSDLDAIFKQGNQLSYYAGLRAVYDAGYAAASGANLATSTQDFSLSTNPPAVDNEAGYITTP